MKFLFVFFMLLSFGLFGQKQARYKTYTYYNYEHYFGKEKTDNGRIYILDEQPVSKKVYRKYKKRKYIEDNHWNCEHCPYNERLMNNEDIMLQEQLICCYCNVGFKKLYYPNGKIKEHQMYKGNEYYPNIPDGVPLNCNVKHGRFIYFSIEGDTLYSEFWENNRFIRQVPEQKSSEIGHVDVLLGKDTLKEYKVWINELTQIQLLPKYKNSNHSDSLVLRLRIDINYPPDSVNQSKLFFREYYGISISAISDTIEAFHFDTLTAKSKSFSLTIQSHKQKESLGLIHIELDSLSAYNQRNHIYPLSEGGREKKFFLVNSEDTNRRILIPVQGVSLKFVEKPNDHKIVERKIDAIANLHNISIDSIYISSKTEYQENQYYDLHKEKNIVSELNGNEMFRTLSLTQVQSIRFQKQFFQRLESSGSLIIFFSTVNTLVVTPLISINYKKWNFNKTRYFNVTKFSLLSMGSGILMVLLGKKKNYRLTIKNGQKGKELWYITAEDYPQGKSPRTPFISYN